MKFIAALYCSIRWIYSLRLICCYIPSLSAASTYNSLQIQSSPSPILKWQKRSLLGCNTSGLWMLRMLSGVVARFQETGSAASVFFSEHGSKTASQGRPQGRVVSMCGSQHWLGGKWPPATCWEKEQPPHAYSETLVLLHRTPPLQLASSSFTTS